jgi:hypothetical protein
MASTLVVRRRRDRAVRPDRRKNLHRLGQPVLLTVDRARPARGLHDGAVLGTANIQRYEAEALDKAGDRAPCIRAALKAAAVCPGAGICPLPNWLVVSTTIRPSSGPASAKAAGIADHGTEKITRSAQSAASAGVIAEARSPRSAASVARASVLREKLTAT